MIDKAFLWESMKGFMIPVAKKLNWSHFMYMATSTPTLCFQEGSSCAIAKGSYQNSTNVFHQSISYVSIPQQWWTVLINSLWSLCLPGGFDSFTQSWHLYFHANNQRAACKMGESTGMNWYAGLSSMFYSALFLVSASTGYYYSANHCLTVKFSLPRFQSL